MLNSGRYLGVYSGRRADGLPVYSTVCPPTVPGRVIATAAGRRDDGRAVMAMASCKDRRTAVFSGRRADGRAILAYADPCCRLFNNPPVGNVFADDIGVAGLDYNATTEVYRSTFEINYTDLIPTDAMWSDSTPGSMPYITTEWNRAYFTTPTTLYGRLSKTVIVSVKKDVDGNPFWKGEGNDSLSPISQVLWDWTPVPWCETGITLRDRVPGACVFSGPAGPATQTGTTVPFKVVDGGSATVVRQFRYLPDYAAFTPGRILSLMDPLAAMPTGTGCGSPFPTTATGTMTWSNALTPSVSYPTHSRSVNVKGIRCQTGSGSVIWYALSSPSTNIADARFMTDPLQRDYMVYGYIKVTVPDGGTPTAEVSLRVRQNWGIYYNPNNVLNLYDYLMVHLGDPVSLPCGLAGASIPLVFAGQSGTYTATLTF